MRVGKKYVQAHETTEYCVEIAECFSRNPSYNSDLEITTVHCNKNPGKELGGHDYLKAS